MTHSFFLVKRCRWQHVVIDPRGHSRAGPQGTDNPVGLPNVCLVTSGAKIAVSAFNRD